MERAHELIFGYGRYGCLGKSLATVELHKVIATVCFLLPLIFPGYPLQEIVLKQQNSRLSLMPLGCSCF